MRLGKAQVVLLSRCSWHPCHFAATAAIEAVMATLFTSSWSVFAVTMIALAFATVMMSNTSLRGLSFQVDWVTRGLRPQKNELMLVQLRLHRNGSVTNPA